MGYYSDGVKRTLTDDQIAIFRHSEVHAIRQARRREEEAQEYERKCLRSPSSEEKIRSKEDSEIAKDAFDLTPPVDDQHDSESEGEIKDESITGSGNVPGGSGLVGEDDEDDEVEYAKFLEQERKEFEVAASRQRLASQITADRNVSTRRKVREMDSIKDSEQVLDYGDEGGASSQKTPLQSTARQDSALPAHGRKIWWPAIGA